MSTEKTSAHKIGTWTAIAIVVANMIGTGAFTSLGFQVQDLHNLSVVLSLWVLGGLLALSGAYSYAEVGTIIKKSGGEYTFLSEIYAPFVGYLSGWVSLTVGFAAPVALSAIAVVEYFPYGHPNLTWASILLVAVITLFHSRSLRSSSAFQNISTLLKVLLIIILVLIGLSEPAAADNVFVGDHYFSEIGSAAFAIALIYVSYAYSGWNAAVYIIDEFKNPKKALTYALIGGTLIVTFIYTLLQYIFLKHVPVAELVGQINVGTIATKKMLGNDFGNLFSLAISVLLISSISAMVWVGPRVTASMAKDHAIWRFFQTNRQGIPFRALWLQFGITALLLLTGTFEQILIYCGFLLTASSMLTVFGVFILRKKRQSVYKKTDTFQSPLFPFFQLIFLFFSMGMIIFTFIDKPLEATLGISNLLVGGITWLIDKRFLHQKK